MTGAISPPVVRIGVDDEGRPIGVKERVRAGADRCVREVKLRSRGAIGSGNKIRQVADVGPFDRHQAMPLAAWIEVAAS